jgi:hypothetical protein
MKFWVRSPSADNRVLTTEFMIFQMVLLYYLYELMKLI